MDFFGGEWRRGLLDQTEKFSGQFLKLFESRSDRGLFPHWIAIGIVGVGGEAGTDHSFVCFFRSCVELSQAGKAARDQRQHACGERIERAEMSDGALA